MVNKESIMFSNLHAPENKVKRISQAKNLLFAQCSSFIWLLNNIGSSIYYNIICN